MLMAKVKPCHPKHRTIGTVALGVRHFCVKCEFASRFKLTYRVIQTKPHPALNDKGLHRERMAVGIEDNARIPAPNEHFIETQLLRLRAKLKKTCLIKAADTIGGMLERCEIDIGHVYTFAVDVGTYWSEGDC